MENFTTALGTAITPDKLMGNVVQLVPFIGVMVVFAFGYSVIKKAVKGASKGKVKF